MVTLLLTSARAFSMLQVILVGAFGPRLVADLDMSRAMLGLTTTAGFGAAAVLSPVAGRALTEHAKREANPDAVEQAHADFTALQVGEVPGPRPATPDPASRRFQSATRHFAAASGGQGRFGEHPSGTGWTP
ncbi:hypothetical protein [Streptomyces sp. NRRL S-337]|uniref:hypothetical protein n=1 Tax=Streptomyces sp. NRRL S-337 TaxID=1463900 RepID=UPI00068F7F80|nr:hypothetical protein [Streptomyces sp. NRRL S-337]